MYAYMHHCHHPRNYGATSVSAVDWRLEDWKHIRSASTAQPCVWFSLSRPFVHSWRPLYQLTRASERGEERTSTMIAQVALRISNLWWWCCCCLLLATTVAMAQRSSSSSTNSSSDSDSDSGNANVDDSWYTGDHPERYVRQYIRTANGSLILNPDATAVNITDTLTNLPAPLRWLMTPATRQQVKQVKKFMLYNFLSVQSAGHSLRAQHLRAQIRKTFALFVMDHGGQQVLTRAMATLRGVYVDGVRQYLTDRIERQRLSTLNWQETQALFNLTLSDADVAYLHELLQRPRANASMRYEAAAPWVLPYEVDVLAFQPYPGYTIQYYDRKTNAMGGQDMDMGMAMEMATPSLPAPVEYPWPWRERLLDVRGILLRIMDQLTEDELRGDHEAMAMIMNEVGDANGGQEHDTDSNHVERDQADDDGMDLERNVMALHALEQRVDAFHFATGLPRIATRADVFHVVRFPSQHELLNGTDSNINGNDDEGSNLSTVLEGGSDLVDAEFELIARSSSSPSSSSSMETSTEHEEEEEEEDRWLAEFYAATCAVYTFPVHRAFFLFKSVDHAEKGLPPRDEGIPMDELLREERQRFASCSLESLCRARSGVTVHTPELMAAVRDVYALHKGESAFATMISGEARNNGSDSDALFELTVAEEEAQQRATRLRWLQRIMHTAVTPELRALANGLQAPSTEWLSFHDRDTDLFADALQGAISEMEHHFAEEQDRSDVPQRVYDALAEVSEDHGVTAPLLSTTAGSYFEQTIEWMGLDDSQSLAPLTMTELADVVSLTASLMEHERNATSRYTRTRDASTEHQRLYGDVERGARYELQEYSELGFGYLRLAANRENVVYRDHKLPQPLHLVLRVLVRMQESALLLRNESYHLTTCLAMLAQDLRFYRCMDGE